MISYLMAAQDRFDCLWTGSYYCRDWVLRMLLLWECYERPQVWTIISSVLLTRKHVPINLTMVTTEKKDWIGAHLGNDCFNSTQCFCTVRLWNQHVFKIHAFSYDWHYTRYLFHSLGDSLFYKYVIAISHIIILFLCLDTCHVPIGYWPI